MSFTEEQFQAFQQRQEAAKAKARGVSPVAVVDDPSQHVRLEADLHDQIFDECRRRLWVAFHGSMAARTHRTEGEPDFIILGHRKNADGALEPWVWLIECKSKTGKSSTAQIGIQTQAARNGHTVHVVRSFQQFLQIVNG